MKSDLKNEYYYNQELTHAKCYQKTSFFSKVCTIIFVLLWALIFLPGILGFEINKKTESVLLWSTGAITFLGSISTLIFARCPKCKKVQPAGYGGAEVGNGVGLSYTKGFTPFRKRCYYCGTYLSVKQLEKDKLKQLNDSEQE